MRATKSTLHSNMLLLQLAFQFSFVLKNKKLDFIALKTDNFAKIYSRQTVKGKLQCRPLTKLLKGFKSYDFVQWNFHSYQELYQHLLIQVQAVKSPEPGQMLVLSVDKEFKVTKTEAVKLDKCMGLKVKRFSRESKIVLPMEDEQLLKNQKQQFEKTLQ